MGLASNGRRLLVVEDDTGIQDLISVLFLRKGIDVDVASGGDEALSKIRQCAYSAILLDLMLPRVNGFEVIRELRSLMPQLLKRTIVITAVSDRTLHNFNEREVASVLRKPFNINELFSMVEQCVVESEKPVA